MIPRRFDGMRNVLPRTIHTACRRQHAYDGVIQQQAPSVLVLGGGGPDETFTRLNNLFGSEYDWYSVDEYCYGFPRCYQLDFNNIAQLDSLPDNAYDIILFDQSVVKFLKWTSLHFLTIKKKLKLGGHFLLPQEGTKALFRTYLPDWTLYAQTRTEAINQLYDAYKSAVSVAMFDPSCCYINPWKIIIQGAPTPYQPGINGYSAMLDEAKEKLIAPLTVSTEVYLSTIFGASSVLQTGYPIPEITAPYFDSVKTSNHVNIPVAFRNENPGLNEIELLEYYLRSMFTAIVLEQ